MKPALIKNTIQRLLSRSLTQLVIIGYAIFVMASIFTGTSEFNGDKTLQMSRSAWFLTWFLGSGVLGSERSDGYLPLLLSRPISRAQYVLSRWAGLVLCVIAVDLALHLIVGLVYVSNHSDLLVLPLLQRWLWFCYFVPLCAAWITLLSALFSGQGDLLYFAGGSVALLYASSKVSGQATQKVGAFLGWLWMPGQITLQAWLAGDLGAVAYSVFFFVALAGTSLALAAYVMQRRDVSYVNR
jgi:ABC-type transport system involved in multi-copper enzyme maturation permease subunit